MTTWEFVWDGREGVIEVNKPQDEPDEVKNDDQENGSGDIADHLTDRIRYWEQQLSIASSGDYSTIRALAAELSTSQGTGPKSVEKIRERLVEKITRRLDTLRAERARRDKTVGEDGVRRDWSGLKNW